MNRFLHAAAVTAVLLLIAADASAQDAQLTGSWIIISAQDAGADVKEPVGDRVTFTNGKMTVQPKDADETAPPPFAIEIDATKSPHQIDITFQQDNTAKLAKGVFAIEGSVLRLCLAFPGNPRPTNLQSERETNQLSLVFERVESQGD